MASNQPLWLRAVLRLERLVGEPVESLVHSDVYFGAVAQVTRSRSQVIGAVESVSRTALHLVNLPAGTDVRRVREQLARMDRRLTQIAKEIEELEERRQQGPAAG
jgi:hypothetical protein